MAGNDAQQAWVERVLGVALTASPWDADSDAEDRPDGPLVAYRKALLGFRAARADVEKQLQSLSERIAEQLPSEAQLATRVAADIGRICDTLSDGIDAGLNALGEGREQQNRKIRDDVLALVAAVGTNPLIAHVDRNPVAPTSVADTLITALTRVAATVN
ncbi:MAG: hypothetical protein JO047_04280 [Alphaproteobacteria bacterium]|nr:hypothetical protein [Alphaproteobacteria bacterium]